MHSCAARLVNRRPFAHVMQLHSVIARPSEYLTHNATLDHDTVDRTRDQSRERSIMLSESDTNRGRNARRAYRWLAPASRTRQVPLPKSSGFRYKRLWVSTSHANAMHWLLCLHTIKNKSCTTQSPLFVPTKFVASSCSPTIPIMSPAAIIIIYVPDQSQLPLIDSIARRQLAPFILAAPWAVSSAVTHGANRQLPATY